MNETLEKNWLILNGIVIIFGIVFLLLALGFGRLSPIDPFHLNRANPYFMGQLSGQNAVIFEAMVFELNQIVDFMLISFGFLFLCLGVKWEIDRRTHNL